MVEPTQRRQRWSRPTALRSRRSRFLWPGRRRHSDAYRHEDRAGAAMAERRVRSPPSMLRPRTNQHSRHPPRCDDRV